MRRDTLCFSMYSDMSMLDERVFIAEHELGQRLGEQASYPRRTGRRR